MRHRLRAASVRPIALPTSQVALSIPLATTAISNKSMAKDLSKETVLKMQKQLAGIYQLLPDWQLCSKGEPLQ